MFFGGDFFVYGGIMDKEPNKLFNLLLPFQKYQALRERGITTNTSIAELIRRGVDFVLSDGKSKKPGSSEG